MKVSEDAVRKLTQMEINKKKLQKLYVENELSQRQVADELNTTRHYVKKYLKMYGIESHTTGGKSKNAPWKSKEKLEKLYYKKYLTISEIAEEFDCSPSSIQQQMKRLGIDRRSPSHQRKVCKLMVGDNGYEVWRPGIDGEVYTVYHHRLLAVAYNGVNAVKNKEIHHKNGVPWDNREENLDIMTPSEHASYHGRNRGSC